VRITPRILWDTMAAIRAESGLVSTQDRRKGVMRLTGQTHPSVEDRHESRHQTDMERRGGRCPLGLSLVGPACWAREGGEGC
jgi:hypothetical protein